MQNKLNTIGAWASILGLIVSILVFIKRRWIIEIVKRVKSWFAKKRRKISFRYRLRRALLSMLQPNLSEISIISICNRGGTVTLILPRQEAMHPGVIYEAWDYASNKVVGLVKIDSVGREQCYSKPVDRIEPHFWAELERRMDKDASPPENIILYPYINLQLQYLIELVIYTIHGRLKEGEFDGSYESYRGESDEHTK
jgi:hypothetical protein